MFPGKKKEHNHRFCTDGAEGAAGTVPSSR